jgi:translation initiation factor IF-1
MGKGSKKGRLTGAQRKEMNQDVVNSVLYDDDIEGVEFGRVLKHLGAGHVRVILSNKREGIAKIRTALSRRGSTPIVTDDIVILSGREFETHADEKMRYDLLGVLGRSEAAKLEKSGRIPAWFLSAGESTGEDIFDYSEIKEEDFDVDAL